MPLDDVQLNPHARIYHHKMGAERQPVLIIDDFLLNPDALIEHACRCNFAREKKLYPGHRAEAPDVYTQALRSALPQLLSRVFDTRPGDINAAESSYSLVTQAPETLQMLQRLPHFDSLNGRELASVYFLCNRDSERYGGTAFYRHRATGFESVDSTRIKTYSRSVEDQLRDGKAPAAGYIYGDTELYQQIDQFAARFNRLILYRCTSLHSGLIDSEFDFSRDPANARLSINTFLVG
ncbi:DUF6445 family protein [Gilvimarinus sp. DA14]|uniref:DUF6445 family protein n=1 Tax=Gilvimarinus sp. DA14 TaxID=2956798 RepID=UPI0020B7404B|nr:DUF6445 family protein [Gilvimarinus sp. DA14]UTF61335.1 DUF6445 family protein [Gilvimarinus sp. DA14]